MTHFASPEQLETPYQRAGQIWDQRIGSARAQAAHLRLFCLILLAINAVLVVLLFVQAQRSHIVPYVIEVDAGKARAVAVAKTYEPNELTLRYFLSNLVSNVRSLPLDAAVIKKNWTEAYQALTPEAAKLLEHEVQKNNPMDQAGKLSKTVAIHNVLSLSKDSYQVDWQEDSFDVDGRQLGSSLYRGVFTVGIVAPRTESDIQKNPLGIFIKHFSWQELRG